MVPGDGHEEAMMAEAEAAPRQEVSKGYRLVIGDEPVIWEWPVNKGEAGGYFLEMKHPGVNEDKITKAAAPDIEVDMRAKTGGASFAANVQAAFVEKCVQQLSNYRLPIRVKRTDGDQEKDATFVPARDGDNRENRLIYEAMLRATAVEVNGEVRNLRKEIEAKFDEVGCRDIPSQEDLDDLGEGPGS